VAGQQRYFDPSQPQTLQIATILLYIQAVFLLLGGAIFSPVGLIFMAAYVGGAFGMANGKKWGYGISLAVAILNLVIPLIGGRSLTNLLNDPIGLMFSIALVALLVHPQSREYQRIWFS
jgi:hypothetical protein